MASVVMITDLFGFIAGVVTAATVVFIAFFVAITAPIWAPIYCTLKVLELCGHRLMDVAEGRQWLEHWNKP